MPIGYHTCIYYYLHIQPVKCATVSTLSSFPPCVPMGFTNLAPPRSRCLRWDSLSKWIARAVRTMGLILRRFEIRRVPTKLCTKGTTAGHDSYCTAKPSGGHPENRKSKKKFRSTPACRVDSAHPSLVLALLLFVAVVDTLSLLPYSFSSHHGSTTSQRIYR